MIFTLKNSPFSWLLWNTKTQEILFSDIMKHLSMQYDIYIIYKYNITALSPIRTAEIAVWHSTCYHKWRNNWQYTAHISLFTLSKIICLKLKTCFLMRTLKQSTSKSRKALEILHILSLWSNPLNVVSYWYPGIDAFCIIRP